MRIGTIVRDSETPLLGVVVEIGDAPEWAEDTIAFVRVAWFDGFNAWHNGYILEVVCK